MSRIKLSALLVFTYCSTLWSQEIDVITQERIQGILTIITYSPDGTLIASGSAKETSVKVWDVKSGKIIGLLEAHEGATTAIAFSPDGTKLVTAAKDNLIISWDIVNWKMIDSLSIGSAVTAIVNDKENPEKFYAGTDKGKVYQFFRNELPTNKELYTQTKSITKIDATNTHIATGDDAGEMVLFSLSENAVMLKKSLHMGEVRGLKFFNNGQNLVSTGGGGIVHLWNVNDLSESKHFKASSALITAFDANVEKGIFVTASAKGDVRVWDMTGAEKYCFSGNDEDNPGQEPIKAIAISPDGTTVASAGYQKMRSRKNRASANVIRIWDVQRGGLYKVLEGTVNRIFTFDFHPTENKLVTLGEDRILTFWDFDLAEKYGSLALVEAKREIPPRRLDEVAESSKETGTRKIGGFIGDLKNGDLNIKDKISEGVENTKDNVKSGVKDQVVGVGTAMVKRSFKERPIVKFSSKGNFLITKMQDDEIRCYKIENGVPTYDKPLFAYQANVNQILTSPDEQFLAVLGSGDKAVSIINMQTGEFIQELDTKAPNPDGDETNTVAMKYAYEANSLAFSPDGKYLAVCFNTSKTYVYNVGSWTVAFQNTLPADMDMGYVKGAFVNFSADGKYMVVRTMQGLQKYNTASFSDLGSTKLKIEGESAPMDNPSNYAITVGDDNYLYFENLVTGTYSKSRRVTPKQVTHVSLSHKGMAGITLRSGQFLLFDPATGNEEVLLVADGDNYIFKTRENYYRVSKEGYDLVTFRIGNQAYPFEQFDAVFNRPDLVLKKMGCKDEPLMALYKMAYEKRIKKLGLVPTATVSLSDIPTMKVSNPLTIPAVSKEESVLLDFTMTDKTALISYNVWVNNVPVYGQNGKPVTGKTFTGKETVALVSGMNKIQISSRNKNGYESLIQTFYVDKPVEKVIRNLYLVTIGTSQYKDTRYNLNYAVKDAKDLVTLFEADTAGVYASVKSKSLYDGDVTSANIEELRAFLSETNPDDVVMVFVAGHGVLDANFDYYFGTYDMDFSNPALKGLAYEKLESLLEGIKANKKILIMDTCHSGEIDEDEVFFSEAPSEEPADADISFRAVGAAVESKGGASPSRLAGELFNDLRRGTGATVISSAGGAEFAMESDEWRNGLFTYCLLSGLSSRHADLDSNGTIMLLELQEYVVDKVKALSKGKQIPNSRIQNMELDFRVW